MRPYNQYILCLAILTGLANTAMAFREQESLEVYLIVNSVLFLGFTVLHIRLGHRTRKAVDLIGLAVFSGIMAIVLVRTIRDLSGH
ncbi:MAG: hypothetical protein QUS33_00700 [Dehalococcoidia bacterium]|nr:hypothetical protein [Dehalococcoidia bacterium]